MISSLSFVIYLLLLWPDVVTEGILHVNESGMATSSNLVNSLEVLIAQFDKLGVRLDALWVGGLWKNSVSTLNSPSDQDLCEGNTKLLSNSVELLVGRNLLASTWNLVLGSERRVRNWSDILRLAVIDELLVWEKWVNLDLVDRWWDLGVGEESLKVLNGPVGDTDGLCETVLDELLHCAPGWGRILGELFVDDVLVHMLDYCSTEILVGVNGWSAG